MLHKSPAFVRQLPAGDGEGLSAPAVHGEKLLFQSHKALKALGLEGGGEQHVELLQGGAQSGVKGVVFHPRPEHLVVHPVKVEPVSRSHRKDPVGAQVFFQSLKRPYAPGVHLKRVALRGQEQIGEQGKLQQLGRTVAV